VVGKQDVGNKVLLHSNEALVGMDHSKDHDRSSSLLELIELK
jgi:hypothetical protein